MELGSGNTYYKATVIHVVNVDDKAKKTTTHFIVDAMSFFEAQVAMQKWLEKSSFSEYEVKTIDKTNIYPEVIGVRS